jgi:hypothetical protein
LLIRASFLRNARTLGVVLRGERFNVTARSFGGLWAFGDNGKGMSGWVLASGLRCTTTIRAASIATPAPVTNRLSPTLTPTPKK